MFDKYMYMYMYMYIPTCVYVHVPYILCGMVLGRFWPGIGQHC